MDDNDKKNQDIFEKMRWLDSLLPLKNIMNPSLMSILNSRNSELFGHPSIQQTDSQIKALIDNAGIQNMNAQMKALVDSAGFQKITPQLKALVDSTRTQQMDDHLKALVDHTGMQQMNAQLKALVDHTGIQHMNAQLKALGELNRFQPLFMDRLNAVSDSFSLLQKMIEIVDEGSGLDRFSINEERSKYFSVESDEVENVVDDLLQKSSPIGIIDKFKRLNPTLQIIIISIFVNFIIPQVNNAFSFFVNRYLDNEFSVDSVSKREAIKEVKSLSRNVQLVDFSGLRFITGTGVRLRKDHTIKSDVLDELVFGQVVEVHTKKKNWIEVSYQYEDGTYMHGWVFTRYTSRFVK